MGSQGEKCFFLGGGVHDLEVWGPLFYRKNKRIYFDHGTVGLDSLYGAPQEDINKIFKGNDIDFKSKVFLDHGHETNFFGERFGIREYLEEIRNKI